MLIACLQENKARIVERLYQSIRQAIGSILDALHRMHLLIDTTLNKLVGEYENRSQLLVRQQYEQLEAHNRGLETQLIRVGEAYQLAIARQGETFYSVSLSVCRSGGIGRRA